LTPIFSSFLTHAKKFVPAAVAIAGMWAGLEAVPHGSGRQHAANATGGRSQVAWRRTHVAAAGSMPPMALAAGFFDKNFRFHSLPGAGNGDGGMVPPAIDFLKNLNSFYYFFYILVILKFLYYFGIF
jgi:hypothetical protein